MMAAELMTGLQSRHRQDCHLIWRRSKSWLKQSVSLYTLRFTDPAFPRLLPTTADARSTYAEGSASGSSRGGAFPRSWKIIGCP